LPVEVQQWLRSQQVKYRLQWPRIGELQFGSLRRTRPISRIFGLDRGLPIDRYYIETFLSTNSKDIQGRVLEIGDDTYTKKFGTSQVTKSDVLHVVEGNVKATILADLINADNIPSDTFDCIIITQTLQMIYDLHSAINHLYRILKPKGVILATSHGITKIARRKGRDPWGEYWHLTTQSAWLLFRERFPDESIRVSCYGNILTAIAYLHGLATEEFRTDELDYLDPDYEVIVAVRAVKPEIM
jgi:SAM-dependent methyltransferase